MSASVSGWWDDFQNLFDEKKAPPPSSTKIEDLSRASYPPRSPGSHPHGEEELPLALDPACASAAHTPAGSARPPCQFPPACGPEWPDGQLLPPPHIVGLAMLFWLPLLLA